MSDKNTDDATHPLNMSKEDMQSTMALLDSEDDDNGVAARGSEGTAAGAATGGADDDAGAAGAGGSDAGAGSGAGADAGAGAAAAADAGAGAAGGSDAADGAGGAAAAGGAAGQGDDDKVDRKAFNGVVAELRQTREELKAVKAQQSLSLAAPEARDFAKEKAELREKWDAGEIDTDQYNDLRDALVVQEAKHGAALHFHSLQQATQKQAAEEEWNSAIGAWQTANADFLANPIREKAVNDLLVSLESDPNNKLSNAELIAKVEELAFDAFSWKREPAAGSAAPATPPASPRAVAAAQAAAAASSTPPLPGRGAGSNLTASQVNLEDVKPGQFGKLPANVQKELLGEDD